MLLQTSAAETKPIDASGVGSEFDVGAEVGADQLIAMSQNPAIAINIAVTKAEIAMIRVI